MTTKPNIILFSIFSIGFLLGISVLSSSAAFQTAPTDPSTCPTTLPGCNPPLNLSGIPQVKDGWLKLKALNSPEFGLTIKDGGLRIIDGNEGVGKVFISNASGVGKWQNPVAGAWGGLVLTAEKSLSTSGSDQSVILAPATAAYPGCFLTNTNMRGTNEFSTGKCVISNNGTDWILTASKNDNDNVTCAARCIGYSAVPTQTCTTPKSNILYNEPVTWTASAGNYQYKFSGQTALSTNNTITKSFRSGTTASMSVTLYNNTNQLPFGTYTCTNTETNTNNVTIIGHLAIRNASPSNTSSAECPVNTFSATAPAAERTLRGDYFGSYTGYSGTWLNASDGILGTGSTYELPPTSGTFVIKYKHIYNRSWVGFQNTTKTCTITVVP